MGCAGGADRTFACKSQECLWQDWYILIYIISDLAAAAGRGDLEELKTLVKKGHHVNVMSWQRNWTPLCLAASNGHTHCVEWFIQHGALVEGRSGF